MRVSTSTSLAVWLGVAGWVWALLTVMASFLWDSFAVFPRCFPASAITAYHLVGWRQAVTGTAVEATFDGLDFLFAASRAWLLVKSSWIGQLGLFRHALLSYLCMHLHHFCLIRASYVSLFSAAWMVCIRLCMRLLVSACLLMPPRRYHSLLTLDIGMSPATFPTSFYLMLVRISCRSSCC